MSNPSVPPFEMLLKLIAGSSPQPWYPAEFARQMAVERDRIDGPLDEMRMAGLIELTPWISGRGQGYTVTQFGEGVLDSRWAMSRLRSGRLPQRTDEPLDDEIDPHLRGTTFGRGEQIRRSLVRPANGRVTYALIAINVAVFLVGVVIAARGNRQAAHQTGSVAGDDLLRGEWWRLLTSCFVHHGWFHLGVNMYSLWAIGRLAEQVWGRPRYLAIYLIAGLAGSCAGMWLKPDSNLAGASGAICGIVGSMPVWLMLNRAHLPPTLVKSWMGQFFTVIFLNIMITVSIANISSEAHFGGGIAGAIVAGLLNFHRYNTTVIRWPALLLVLLVPVISVGLVVRATQPGGRWQKFTQKNELDVFQQTVMPGIQRAREQGRAAINHADEVRRSKPAADRKTMQAARQSLREAHDATVEARKALQLASKFEARRLRNMLLTADDAFAKQLEVLDFLDRNLADPQTWQQDDENALVAAVEEMTKLWGDYADLRAGAAPAE